MFTAERYLGAGSALASAHPAFRVRPGQMALADAVARAFAGDGHLVAEAGTGVGKSLAYLIPAAFAGRRIVEKHGGKHVKHYSTLIAMGQTRRR